MALTLVSLGLLALISCMLYAGRMSREVNQRDEAAAIASSLMARSESTLRQSFQTDVSHGRAPLTDPTLKPGYEYEIVQQLEPSGLKYIEVRLFWTEERGPQQLVLWTRVLP